MSLTCMMSAAWPITELEIPFVQESTTGSKQSLFEICSSCYLECTGRCVCTWDVSNVTVRPDRDL